jgi:hypothetical protein
MAVQNPSRPAEVIREGCVKSPSFMATAAAEDWACRDSRYRNYPIAALAHRPSWQCGRNKAGWSTAATWLCARQPVHALSAAIMTLALEP